MSGSVLIGPTPYRSPMTGGKAGGHWPGDRDVDHRRAGRRNGWGRQPATLADLGGHELVELARSALTEPHVEFRRLVCRARRLRVPVADDGGVVPGAGHCRGRRRRGSVVAVRQLLRSFRHWPLVDIVPPEVRERLADEGVWRYEVDVYQSGLGSALPAGCVCRESTGCTNSARAGLPSGWRMCPPRRCPGTVRASRGPPGCSSAREWHPIIRPL